MEQRITQGEQNLLLLQSVIPEGEKLYVWCYDSSGSFIATSCPEESRELLEQTFLSLGGKDKLLRYAGESGNTLPEIIGSPIGAQWALSYETERSRRLLFVIGPVFYAQPLEHQLRRTLYPYVHGGTSGAWAGELLRRLGEIPVLPYAVFVRYVLMVHNTLTGQQLGLDALEAGTGENRQVDPAGQRNRTEVYLAEQALLQMVRNGDINYQSALQRSILQSPGVPVKGQDPLRQMKTSIVVFTSLVCRAAIEGGLSPEVAYALGDSYIQSAEDSRDSGELSALAHAMYHDFIYRVHHLRTNPNYSHAVQKCCDYIELSLDRKIRTADLAALVGYTEYYLTEKFKKETGQSVSSYIRYARVERAKVLLETTDLTVREIAERLAFNTPNYFIQSFRDVTGYAPARYRKKFKRE